MAGNRAYKTYNIIEVRKLSESELRKAYSAIRDVAQKRSKRLEAVAGRTDLVKSLDAPKLKDLKSVSEIRSALLDLSNAIKDPRSKLSTYKSWERKNIESLKRAGYDIKRENLKEFGEFMELMRERFKVKHIPGSDQIASIFSNTQELGIPIETVKRQFGSYLNDIARARALADTLQRINTVDRMSAKRVREELKRDWGSLRNAGNRERIQNIFGD